MKSHAFQFGNLPPHLQELVISFSNGKEAFHPIMKVSNKIYQLVNAPILFTTIFFNHLKLSTKSSLFETFCKLNSKERRYFAKECIYTTTERLDLFSYYTDGGVYSNDALYFISNVYKDNPANLYSTIKTKNVHVKTLLSNGMQAKANIDDITSFQSKPDENGKIMVYKVPYLHDCPIHDLSFLSTFGVIKYFDLNRALTTYTCFLKSWALFISMDEIDSNCDIVKLFDDIDDITKAKSLGFETHALVVGTTASVLEFNLSSLSQVEKVLKLHRGANASLKGVYPLLYGDVTKSAANYLNIIQRVGFRHLLLKLIDSFKEGDSNIDCYNITVSGTVVKMKQNHEE